MPDPYNITILLIHTKLQNSSSNFLWNCPTLRRRIPVYPISHSGRSDCTAFIASRKEELGGVFIPSSYSYSVNGDTKACSNKKKRETVIEEKEEEKTKIWEKSLGVSRLPLTFPPFINPSSLPPCNNTNQKGFFWWRGRLGKLEDFSQRF